MDQKFDTNYRLLNKKVFKVHISQYIYAQPNPPNHQSGSFICVKLIRIGCPCAIFCYHADQMDITTFSVEPKYTRKRQIKQMLSIRL